MSNKNAGLCLQGSAVNLNKLSLIALMFYELEKHKISMNVDITIEPDMDFS